MRVRHVERHNGLPSNDSSVMTVKLDFHLVTERPKTTNSNRLYPHFLNFIDEYNVTNKFFGETLTNPLLIQRLKQQN